VTLCDRVSILLARRKTPTLTSDLGCRACVGAANRVIALFCPTASGYRRAHGYNMETA
jgi:hypothetical protein